MNTITEEALAITESALQLIATPKRPDGTYNRDRKACELLAKEALEKIQKLFVTPEERNDWNLEFKKELYAFMCKLRNMGPSYFFQEERIDEKAERSWFADDLKKVLMFSEPKELVGAYDAILEKYGEKFLTIEIGYSWNWKNVEWRGKEFRAATFLASIYLGNGKEPMKEYVEKEPVQGRSSRKPKGVFLKDHPLIKISSLFAVRDAFKLTEFHSYEWTDEGFKIIGCDSKKHTKEIQKTFVEFMGDEAEKVEMNLEKKEVHVILK